MLAIYKKELKSYFTSMIGYVFIAFFLVIIGVYFVAYNIINQYANFEYVLSSVSFVFVLLVPILTMRIMAEEKRQKTDQLLFTSPLPLGKIVAGKYFAVLTVFLIVMGVICLYPVILLQFGAVPLRVAYGSILGFVFLGAAYIAIGLFISALTESQVVAAVISFITILLTALMDSLVGLLPKDNKSAWIIFSVILILICWVTYVMMHNVTISLSLGLIGEVALTIIYMIKPTLFDGLVAKVFGWFSVIARYNNYTKGVLDLSSVIYYISVSFLFLFLTVQAIKKSRWS
jgi:ABC-2 type transport system permease protein